eukprot:m.178631 g.178631  ORF g.178631 m.178631 type:complete len:951 (+) comp13559_c1_seq15:40-2892(+)
MTYGLGVDGCGLGVTSFYAAPHPTDKCGPRGLPLTPNSVRVLGNMQKIMSLSHPSLVEYVTAEVGTGERVFLVAEHYDETVADLIHNDPQDNRDGVVKMLYEVLNGLVYLHRNKIVCRSISPEHIELTDSMKPKLSQYALFTCTDCGAAVSFPIVHPKYMSPSVLRQGPHSHKVGNPKDDVWAFGICALEMITKTRAWSHHQESVSENSPNDKDCESEALKTILSTIKSFGRKASRKQYNARKSFEEKVVYLNMFCDKASARLVNEEKDKHIVDLIFACLDLTSSTRPSADDLLGFELFSSVLEEEEKKSLHPNIQLQCGSVDVGWALVSEGLRKTSDYLQTQVEALEKNPLYGMKLKSVFYLWSLTTRNIEAYVDEKGQSTNPSVHRLPRLIRLGLPEIGAKANPSWMFDSTVTPLDLSKVISRLIEDNVDPFERVLPLEDLPLTGFCDELAKQPLMVRNRNLIYQYERVRKFERLLIGAPFTTKHIQQEALTDIPPHVRGGVWRVLLGVTEECYNSYTYIDKDKETTTDRQLDVDIPRCHQYYPLLSSPAGHVHLKRVLKAWIVSHPHLVYWQGLDSLSAPFVILNFEDEAAAYACLVTFVNKFVPNLFKQHNTDVLNTFLSVFWNMLSFHDPQLWWHLEEMMFKPDLFAISWFLTCYAHVFSLDKIFVLWDALLQSSSSMLVFFGVAILLQLRSQLLSFEFNECILHFSDAPDVDIEVVVKVAEELYSNTPQSLSRLHFEEKECSRGEGELEVLSIGNPHSQFPILDIADFESLFLSSKMKPYSASSARLICIDVRSSTSFFTGHCDGLCFNLPRDELFLDRVGKEVACTFVSNNAAGRTVVVIGDTDNNNVNEVALELVKFSIPRVCVLGGGVSILRQRGLLTTSGKDINLGMLMFHTMFTPIIFCAFLLITAFIPMFVFFSAGADGVGVAQVAMIVLLFASYRIK